MFSIKEKWIIGYFYKYTRATYNWFCAPGSQYVQLNLLGFDQVKRKYKKWKGKLRS